MQSAKNNALNGKGTKVQLDLKSFINTPSNGGTPQADIPDFIPIIIIVGAIGGIIGVIVFFIKKGSGDEVERIEKIVDEL